MDKVKCDRIEVLNDDIDLRDALGTDKHWKWCVYWYESGYYEGSGELVCCDDDDMLYSCNLNHCSCYGPGDGGVSQECSLAEYLASKDVIEGYNHGIDAKIRELAQA